MRAAHSALEGVGLVEDSEEEAVLLSDAVDRVVRETAVAELASERIGLHLVWRAA